MPPDPAPREPVPGRPALGEPALGEPALEVRGLRKAYGPASPALVSRRG